VKQEQLAQRIEERVQMLQKQLDSVKIGTGSNDSGEEEVDDEGDVEEDDEGLGHTQEEPPALRARIA